MIVYNHPVVVKSSSLGVHISLRRGAKQKVSEQTSVGSLLEGRGSIFEQPVFAADHHLIVELVTFKFICKILLPLLFPCSPLLDGSTEEKIVVQSLYREASFGCSRNEHLTPVGPRARVDLTQVVAYFDSGLSETLLALFTQGQWVAVLVEVRLAEG